MAGVKEDKIKKANELDAYVRFALEQGWDKHYLKNV